VQAVVLDTNIVLDMFVFHDPAAQPIVDQLHGRTLRWLATPAMREELLRVLSYPHIAKRLVFQNLPATNVLESFDQHAQLVPVPTPCALRCQDPDDQKFIDLAVACQALLLSKDQAVLRMKKKLLPQGVSAQAAIN
jgi:putative PIN family toxin of toxin-antitoxin system